MQTSGSAGCGFESLQTLCHCIFINSRQSAIRGSLPHIGSHIKSVFGQFLIRPVLYNNKLYRLLLLKTTPVMVVFLWGENKGISHGRCSRLGDAEQQNKGKKVKIVHMYSPCLPEQQTALSTAPGVHCKMQCLRT